MSIGKWDFLSFVSVFAAASADAVSARTVAAQNEFLLHGAIMPERTQTPATGQTHNIRKNAAFNFYPSSS